MEYETGARGAPYGGAMTQGLTSVARPNGYILLPVVLLITLVAAAAFMLNNESVLETSVSIGSIEDERVNYVTDAGTQHALWQVAQAGCGPYTDISAEAFGDHSYSATITPNNAGGSLSTFTVAVTDDAWIKSETPSQNYGNDAQLTTYFNFSPSTTQRTLYRFDVEAAGIASGAMVVSAMARIFVLDSNTGAGVTAHQVTADWTEAAVNWDNINSNHNSSSAASIAAGSPAGAYVDFNITGLVQSWINGSVSNQGIMLKTTSIGDLTQYTSKEYGTASQRPELVIKVADGSLSNRADISVIGMLASGTSSSMSRNDISLYQPPSSVTLQPDAASGKDAEIWDQAPNNNYGDAAVTWVSSLSNDTTRSLLNFNMGEVPVGSRILGATLSLQRVSGSGSDQPVSAHRIMKPWSEDSVTWNSREAGTSWDTAGGDFENMAVVTTPVGPVNQRYEWNIAPLAQGWVDGTYPNYGVVLTAAIAGVSGQQFYTSDHTNPSLHPRLTITYACECGVTCQPPQGSGNILLAVGDNVTLASADVKKQALFESWGYTVNLIDDDADQVTYDAALAGNDVAYISETVRDPTLAAKLADTAKGVVNEEEDQNSRLGLSSSGSNITGDSMEIADNSHYITALFANGVLPIFSAPMEGMLVTGTPAPDLQILGNFVGNSSLALVEAGGALGGDKNGENAAGRRVAIPIGSNDKFNWDYLNNNGRLIVQRAIQWGTGNLVGACSDGNYRDEFSAPKFDNNDGSINWATDWIEVDASGSGAGSGKARVFTGEIRLQGTPSGDSPSLAREMDLSEYQAAALSFDYRTGAGVEAKEDSAVVEISADGGSNWVELESFIEEGPSASGSRNYDISSYISANTQIRFRINLLYGGTDEYFYVDNVDVTAGCDPLPPTPLTAPIAHWKLDDGAGTIALDSEGGHDGTLVNGPSWVAGQDGDALDFDGANDRIDVPHADTLSLANTMSFTSWINPQSIGGNYNTIIAKDGGGATSNYYFGLWQDEIVFGFFAGATFREVFTDGLGIQAGSWQHIAATFDDTANEVLLYLDGSLVHTGVINFSPTAVNADLTIGRSPDGEFWNGLLDDVRIYDSVLSAADISDLASGGGSGGGGGEPPPPDSCDGIFRDEFNNPVYSGNDGTLKWAGDWEEINESDGPTSGDERVFEDLYEEPAMPTYQLFVRDNDGKGEGVMRALDLTGAASAVLSFEYKPAGLDNSNDYASVQMSTKGTGGPWTEIVRFAGKASETAYQSYKSDISAYISSDAVLRIITSSDMGPSDYVFFDNIQIQCKP